MDEIVAVLCEQAVRARTLLRIVVAINIVSITCNSRFHRRGSFDEIDNFS